MAKEKGTEVGDLVVIMLDRPRHEEQMAEIRKAGARIRLIPHGDVSASLAAVSDETPIDLLWGIGGTPEGVISAAAIKCVGGKILGKLWPRNDEERQAAIDAGYDLDEVLDTNRLVSGDSAFFAATGVTDGDLLKGVQLRRRQRHHRVDLDALALRHRPPHHCSPRSPEAAGDRGGEAGLTPSAGGVSAPTFDSARSSRASERRKAWVTITWIRSWVAR